MAPPRQAGGAASAREKRKKDIGVSRLAGRLERLERLFIVRMLADFGNVLAIGDLVVLVHDEDRSREQRDRQSLDQDAIILAERLVVKIGQALQVGDAFRV